MMRSLNNYVTVEEDVNDDDEFFGDQSNTDSESFSSISKQQYGNLSDHEHRSKEDHFFKLGYLEAYDESKDVMLQGGFEAGYRQALADATTVGKFLGKTIASEELHKTLDSSEIAKKHIAHLVRNFLETEHQKESASIATTSRDSDGRIIAATTSDSILELLTSMKGIIQ